MKLIVSQELKSKRKKTAADGHTKIKVVFTACSKDLSHENFPDKGNPQAPWFKENRTDMEPATFVKCFTSLPDYPDQDMEYFANCICVDSRVTVKLYSTMQDFIEAYSAENYSTIAQAGDSTLHNSCMRHEETARNAADFYFNFAGAMPEQTPPIRLLRYPWWIASTTPTPSYTR